MSGVIVYFPGDRAVVPQGNYFLVRENGDRAVIGEFEVPAGAWPGLYGPVPLPEGSRLGLGGNVSVYAGKFDEGLGAWVPAERNPLLTQALRAS